MMNTDTLMITVRSKLDDWFVPFVVILAVVLLVSGWGVYTAVAASPEPTEYEQVESWSTTTDITHSAEVREPNAVYEVGERVSDEPRYYTEVMPILEGQLEYSYIAAEGDVDIETETTQLIRSVDDDDSTVYWSVETPLDVTQSSGVDPNSPHTTSFAVEVEALSESATETADSLGSTAGTLETAVQITATMEGTIDGEPVNHTETYEIPIEVTTGTYSLEPPDDTGHTETETVATANRTDRLADAAGMGAILLVSVGTLGTLVAAKRRGRLAPTAAERRAVENASKRAELEEWISRGSIPQSLSDKPRIEVTSLTELVDVAIDCNRRVIERENAAEYVVLDNGTIYAYSPDNSVRAPAQQDGTTEAQPQESSAGMQSDADTPDPSDTDATDHER